MYIRIGEYILPVLCPPKQALRSGATGFLSIEEGRDSLIKPRPFLRCARYVLLSGPHFLTVKVHSFWTSALAGFAISGTPVVMVTR